LLLAHLQPSLDPAAGGRRKQRDCRREEEAAGLLEGEGSSRTAVERRKQQDCRREDEAAGKLGTGRKGGVRREEGTRCSCTHSKCSRRLEAGGEV
jgi:hypothetical protein